MFKHIVMWKLGAAEGRSKEDNVRRAKALLDGLKSKIPRLRALEVGINALPGQNASDLVLSSEFDNFADFENYLKHPEHLKVVEALKASWTERRAVDYET